MSNIRNEYDNYHFEFPYANRELSEEEEAERFFFFFGWRKYCLCFFGDQYFLYEKGNKSGIGIEHVVGFVFGGFKKVGRQRFLEFSKDVFPWWAVSCGFYLETLLSFGCIKILGLCLHCLNFFVYCHLFMLLILN